MAPDSAQSASTRRAVIQRDDLPPEAQEAVETFMFDVSLASELSSPPASSEVGVGLDRLQDLLPELDSLPEGKTTGDGKKRRRAARGPLQLSPPKVAKKSRWSSWLVSLVAHAAIMISISFITIKTLEKPVEELILSVSSESYLPDESNFEDAPLDSLSEFQNAESQIGSEITEVNSSLADELNAELGMGGISDSLEAARGLGDGTGVGDPSGLGDVSGLFGSTNGGGSGGLGEVIPSGRKLTASFFGTKVDGRRILYVLDNSGGMRDGKLETLVEELLRSVESLSPEQEFYVIFYSDMLYPLFYPRPVDRFVPANDRFKQRLKAWLDTVEFSMGNTVDQAIQVAGTIYPDAVYLLTDGNVETTKDGRRMAVLLDTQGREFPIHTFGIGMEEHNKAADNLRLVAEANHGTFRTVEVSREAKDLAREKKRPYHSKEPGEVWGQNVRSWGR